MAGKAEDVTEAVDLQPVQDAPLPVVEEAVEAEAPVADAVAIEPAPEAAAAAVPAPRGRKARKPAAVPAAPVVAEEPAPAVAVQKRRPVGRPRRATPEVPPVKAAAAKPVRKIADKKTKTVAAPKPSVVKAPTRKVAVAAAPAKLKTKIAPIAPIKATGDVRRAVAQLKDKPMTQTDFIAPLQTVFADLQTKAKAAYEKGTEALTEANDFAKGNVEAVVESGKIFAAGIQDLGTTAVAETRSAFEAMTADVKELASVKSPTEFFQLQSALVRKSFDSMVAQASKSTEAMLKLANDVATPISSRVSLAVEKVAKVA